MKKALLVTILGLSLFGLSLSASTPKNPGLDQMTLDERKKSGIEKLSFEERIFLEQWIKNPRKERPKGLRRAVFISEMAILKLLEGGKLITLENGDVFEVTSHYQKKVKEWKIGDKVRVYQSKKPFWFKFELIPSQTIVGVKKVLQIEKNQIEKNQIDKNKDPQLTNV